MFVLPAKFLADDVKVGIFREIRFVSVRKVGRLQQKTFPRGCGKDFSEKFLPAAPLGLGLRRSGFPQVGLEPDCGDPAAISTGSHVRTHSVLSSERVASNIAAGWR